MVDVTDNPVSIGANVGGEGLPDDIFRHLLRMSIGDFFDLDEL